MGSYNGNLIIKAMAAMLGRELGAEEMMCCEEMAYAFYAPAVIGEIRRTAKLEPRKRTFDHIYQPVMRGRLVNAKRVPLADHVRLSTPTNFKVYALIAAFLGDGFSQKDLDEIVGICKNATLPEVQDAMRVSSSRGIRSASYIRSIIVGKRRVKKAQAAYEKDRYKKVADPPPISVRSDEISENKTVNEWAKRIERNAEDTQISQAAARKLRL